MHLLLANDDGIYSPGLAALASVSSRFGEVHVVAPDVEQSSIGHAITHSRPLSVKQTPVGGRDGYRVNGTPADCVALGLELFPDVEVVLSGINLGPNLGNSVWHSGTLAAAKEAALLGRRGIAFSTPTGSSEPNFDALAPWVTQVLELLLPQRALRLVNVNLPLDPVDLRWTRQAVAHYDAHVVPGQDPMGRKHYWITVRRIEAVEEGTDRWAMRNRFVSITPLRLDLTDYEVLTSILETEPTLA